ncbi:MAG TPA: hypothetical protein VHI95_03290 [Acidimicrobiales bacterium]|jgi:hypothetical protein|nr:hypothetical protein [Acidimicrobiales bacterium]
MSVEVSPEEFSLVNFDAAEIKSAVEKLIPAIGLSDDLDIRIEVDEATPLGRATVASYDDPVVITVESGALEDPKRPRRVSPSGAADVLGRLLFRVRDRRTDGFGDPPPDAELPMPESVAWDVYCIGRLVRLGFKHYDNRQRRLYHFRNRHGFTDAADEAFERLWTADDLTWSDIAALSEKASAAAA